MSQGPDAALLAARMPVLAYQSPYHFLPLGPPGRQQPPGLSALAGFGEAPLEEIVPTAGMPGQWLLRKLAWDTQFFGTPTYRLVTALFAPGAAGGLGAAAAALRETLAARGDFYAFSMVPAEDIQLLQALTAGGWQLIETRLHYYHDAVAGFAAPRVAVRPARPDEAPRLGQVAAQARNPFDRFHADPWFGPERADALLASYATAAATRAVADEVLVPDEAGLEVDSFLAISDLAADSQQSGGPLSRVLLAAVGPSNRGWHRRLLSEAVHRARELRHQYVLMTTQATNRAVIHNAETLGFQLGAASHVLACHLSLPA